MKRVILAVLMIAAVCGPAMAESFRIGGIAGFDVLESRSEDAVHMELEGNSLMPGWYFEVMPGQLGFGMTNLVKFSRHHYEAPASVVEKDEVYTWYFDWIAPLELRYHVLAEHVVDPFIGVGFGSAGRVKISPEDEHELDVRDDERVGEAEGEEDLVSLSLFGEIGAGIGLRLEGLHLGAKASYRFSESPIPATEIPSYPLRQFHVGFFAGLSF